MTRFLVCTGAEHAHSGMQCVRVHHKVSLCEGGVLGFSMWEWQGVVSRWPSRGVHVCELSMGQPDRGRVLVVLMPSGHHTCPLRRAFFNSDEGLQRSDCFMCI